MEQIAALPSWAWALALERMRALKAQLQMRLERVLLRPPLHLIGGDRMSVSSESRPEADRSEGASSAIRDALLGAGLGKREFTSGSSWGSAPPTTRPRDTFELTAGRAGRSQAAADEGPRDDCTTSGFIHELWVRYQLRCPGKDLVQIAEMQREGSNQTASLDELEDAVAEGDNTFAALEARGMSMMRRAPIKCEYIVPREDVRPQSSSHHAHRQPRTRPSRRLERT